MGKRKLNSKQASDAQNKPVRAAAKPDAKRQRSQPDAKSPAAKTAKHPPAKHQEKREAPVAEPSASPKDDVDVASDSSGASSEGASASSSSSHGASVDDGEELQVEFDFGDPEEEDFHIVKALLQRYLHDPNFDSSTMADIIVDKAEVSVALRTTESCVGVAAFLPWAAFATTPPFQQLATAWRKHAAAGGCSKQLESSLTGGRAALLVSERVHNAPAQVAAGMFGCLCKELSDAAACGDKGVRRHADFDTVLVCAKAYEDRDGGVKGTGAVSVTRTGQNGASASQAADTVASGGAQPGLVFMKAEDEALFERCAWSCSWPLPQDGSFKGQVSLHRVLMCVKRSKLDAALRHTAALFGHDLRQHGL